LLEAAPNHYDVLGVQATASPDEIRRRYKFLVIAFHPDRFLRTPEHHALAEQRIKQVNEAYRVLSNPQSRSEYDLARLSSFAGMSAGVTVQPFLAQLQHEALQSQARSAQLEHEVASWRTRYEAVLSEKALLQQAQADRQLVYEQEQQALQAVIDRLTHQLERLAQEQAAKDGQTKEQQSKANKKAARLAQQLATQERLVENLAATKAEWERSNQSRFDLLSEQVRKLQEELKRRDASLAQRLQVQGGLEARLASAEHEARLAAQSMASALRAKELEAETLLADSKRAGDIQVREQKWVRLWQLVAVIAILNTLLLLGLLLAR
jgi:curved DNA-binding protein CbpA